VRAHRRLLGGAVALLTLATATSALAWLVFDFVPLRPGVGGALAAAVETPASAARLARVANPDAQWPMFGASPARTRFVPSSLRPPFRRLYTIPGHGLIEMPPVVAQGRLVFGNHDGLVIATRVRDGSTAWVTSINRCIASSPAVRGDVVYIGWSSPAPCRPGKTERGGIVALDLATGEVLWRFATGNVESSPAVVGDTLYFSAFRDRRESRVYALRVTAPRRVRWSVPVASKVASSPAVTNGTVYVAAYDRTLYGLATRTGRVRFRTSAFSDEPEVRFLLGVRSLVRRSSWSEGGYYATPALAYRRAYVGAIDGVFSVFHARSGAHVWSRKLGGSIYGSAAVWRQKVYIGTTSGAFYALSALDGRVLWKHDLPGKILGSPTVTNDRVYIATTARSTFVFHARTGELEWRFADGHYSPLVLAGKRAYLVGKGRVYALANALGHPGCIEGWRSPC
jgi:outer membrane protein assembly factor BamB